jgi:hypothetical protein
MTIAGVLLIINLTSYNNYVRYSHTRLAIYTELSAYWVNWCDSFVPHKKFRPAIEPLCKTGYKSRSPTKDKHGRED